jgi:hypothetical protein
LHASQAGLPPVDRKTPTLASRASLPAKEMVRDYQPLPKGSPEALPGVATVLAQLPVDHRPPGPAPVNSGGVILLDARTLPAPMVPCGKDDRTGARIIELPRDDSPELTDLIAIDSAEDGTRGTTLEEIALLISPRRLVFRQDTPVLEATFFHRLGIVPQVMLLDSADRAFRAECIVDAEKVRIRLGLNMTFVVHLL